MEWEALEWPSETLMFFAVRDLIRVVESSNSGARVMSLRVEDVFAISP